MTTDEMQEFVDEFNEKAVRASLTARPHDTMKGCAEILMLGVPIAVTVARNPTQWLSGYLVGRSAACDLEGCVMHYATTDWSAGNG